LNVLKQIAEFLIDIHSQHQTLLLNESDFQLELLDAFADTKMQFDQYKKEFKELGLLKQKLNSLLEQEISAKKELDYFQFLFDEFENIEIQTGQLEKLETESSSIENAEIIKTNLLNAANILNGEGSSLLSGLNQAKQQIGSISKYNNNYVSFYERINSIYIELKDLASEFENAEREVHFDANRLEEINSQMDKLNRLMKKHHVKTEQALIEIKLNIESKLIGFNSLENEIQKAKKELEIKEPICLQMATSLSESRKAATTIIEKKVKNMLSELSMLNADFKIELIRKLEMTANGIDGVLFLFSANKGIALNELSKVASGGELSRLMLTLKSLLASKKKLPTIIFDEIDTGVSGEVANKIGNILFKMGEKMQVMAITHLPQMASKGSNHLFVYKKDEQEKTSSMIKFLKGEERVNEIAKMLLENCFMVVSESTGCLL
jgi:DNA repair protein RecN (Recombination protein N)